MTIPTTPEGWQSIETAPKDGRTLLLGRFNSHGKWRTMRGQWFSADAIAESWEEPDGWDEGWYETSVECEDVPNCWWTEPTHWQPLPPAPSAALRCESVSVTLTETDRSDLRVAANIIDRDGPSPIGVELAATLRRIASAGAAPSQAPSGDCVAITGLKGRTVAYAVYAGSESGTASVQFFFNDGTGFVVAASGKNVLNFRPVEQIPGALAHDARGDAPTVFDELIAFEETCEVKPTFADAIRIALAAKKRTSGVAVAANNQQDGTK